MKSSTQIEGQKSTTNDPVLSKEIEAAKILLSNLGDLAGDDDFRHDAVEGETNLFEAIQIALKKVGEDEAAAAGIEEYIGNLKVRKDRLTERAKITRHAIHVAMRIAGVQKLETPIATASVTKVNPSVNVTDESAIPTKYWITGEPQLDKKALLSDLKAIAKLPEDQRTAIGGAELKPESTTIKLLFK
jgi:hypothetical protein